MINFSFRRAFAIARKEFIKIKLDPTTLGMILSIPILQIILFGYAIEFFPKHLPTAIVNYDSSPLTRQFIKAIENSQYFNIKYPYAGEKDALSLLRQGNVNYIITIPVDFTKDIVRGTNPHILLEADASAPGIMGGTLKTVEDIQKNVFNRVLQGTLNFVADPPPVFTVDVHAVYNPSFKSTNTIVPSLIGVILMLSLSLVTSMTIIEEKIAGNMEVLLNSHIQPLEIMFGKFFSYLIIGYIQLLAILYVAGDLLFNVPMRGNLIMLLLISFPFLMGNLMLGLAASTIASTQVQAQQLVTFFFLPSLLLSGFLFPFYGMPHWAQVVGNLLPLTHYMRIISGIMLKDYSWVDIIPDLWPILIFVILVTWLSIVSFKRTLD